MLGITFKENCPDVRNTKIVDILNTLNDYQIDITIYDPWAEPAEVKYEYGWDSVKNLTGIKDCDVIILGVAHDEFRDLNLASLCKQNKVIYDVKGILPKDVVDARL